MNKTVVSNSSVEKIENDWGSLQWLVTGKAGNSNNMTLGRVTIKQGKANPHHIHPNCEEILYVESGSIEHTLPEGGTVEMNKGDCIVVPQEVWHHARNIGDNDAILIVSFNHAWRETVGEE